MYMYVLKRRLNFYSQKTYVILEWLQLVHIASFASDIFIERRSCTPKKNPLNHYLQVNIHFCIIYSCIKK